MKSAANLPQLPLELCQIIWQQLESENVQILIPCALVCRRWLMAVRPFLYRQIDLRSVAQMESLYAVLSGQRPLVACPASPGQWIECLFLDHLKASSSAHSIANLLTHCPHVRTLTGRVSLLQEAVDLLSQLQLSELSLSHHFATEDHEFPPDFDPVLEYGRRTRSDRRRSNRFPYEQLVFGVDLSALTSLARHVRVLELIRLHDVGPAFCHCLAFPPKGPLYRQLIPVLVQYMPSTISGNAWQHELVQWSLRDWLPVTQNLELKALLKEHGPYQLSLLEELNLSGCRGITEFEVLWLLLGPGLPRLQDLNVTQAFDVVLTDNDISKWVQVRQILYGLSVEERHEAPLVITSNPRVWHSKSEVH